MLWAVSQSARRRSPSDWTSIPALARIVLFSSTFVSKLRSIQENLVETGVAKRPLEGLLTAGAFLCCDFTAATSAFAPGAFLLKTQGFADGVRGRMSGAAYVVLHTLVSSQIIQVM